MGLRPAYSKEEFITMLRRSLSGKRGRLTAFLRSSRPAGAVTEARSRNQLRMIADMKSDMSVFEWAIEVLETALERENHDVAVCCDIDRGDRTVGRVVDHHQCSDHRDVQINRAGVCSETEEDRSIP